MSNTQTTEVLEEEQPSLFASIFKRDETGLGKSSDLIVKDIGDLKNTKTDL